MKNVLLLVSIFFCLSLLAIAEEGPNFGQGIIPKDAKVLEKGRISHNTFSDSKRPGKPLLGNNYRTSRRHTFKNGTESTRSQYHFKGVPVIGAEVVVNTQQDSTQRMDGFEFQINPNLNVTPSASLENAISAAKSYFEGDKNFVLQDARLAILCTDDAEYLVWSFILYDGQHTRWQFMMDAHDSATIRAAYNLIQTTVFEAKTQLVSDGVLTGNPVTMYASDDTGKYRLSSKIEGTEIRTYNMKKSSSTSNGSEDDSASLEVWEDSIVGTAHYYTEQLDLFYKEVFGRNSLDNNFFTLHSRVRYGNAYDNAFWDGSQMTYGDGSWNGTSGYFSPLCVADVIGHELSHGFTSNSSGLIYRNESGAMSESISDILGNSFEYWLKIKIGHEPSDWTKVGEECTPAGSQIGRDALRYMEDPTLAKNPKEYKGEFWYSGTGDNGGVHYNCGVGNRAFYLMAAGGEQNGIQVKGIGVLLAAKIIYYSNAKYLTASSNYATWPTACAQACNDITDGDIQTYGNPGTTRQQMIDSVQNAWRAVKVLTE